MNFTVRNSLYSSMNQNIVVKVQYILTWIQEPLKDNCKFHFYYNKTDITPTVLDGGNEIILANWPSDKHIICTIYNDIPIKIPSHPYVLVNRSVLCNCGIEAKNHFLLEFLAACQDSSSKITMYLTVNSAFLNYLEHFPKLMESLSFPIIKNKTTFEQTLPISLYVSKFDSNLLTSPIHLKDFIHRYIQNKEIFDLDERHATIDLGTTNKNFFSNNHLMDIFCISLQ